MKDGGPAFPGGHGTLFGPTAGMSLRDYFASEILGAMISTFQAPSTIDQTHQQKTSRVAYEWADAMLKARAA